MYELVTDSDIEQVPQLFISTFESLSTSELKRIITESIGELPPSMDNSREGLLDLIAGLIAIGFVSVN
jgi:ATP-dependent exoDNAse (exonuclease V) beta subunit